MTMKEKISHTNHFAYIFNFNAFEALNSLGASLLRQHGGFSGLPTLYSKHFCSFGTLCVRVEPEHHSKVLERILFESSASCLKPRNRNNTFITRTFSIGFKDVEASNKQSNTEYDQLTTSY